MLIRKNHTANHSEYHKLILNTLCEQQNLTRSIISQEGVDSRTFDTQNLVQKIKEQDEQIQKLLKIIDKYKSKIEEFQQYEEVIKDFFAKKQIQKSLIHSKNASKLQNLPTSSENTIFFTGLLTKSKKHCILPSYSITILCQNQRTQKQKYHQQIMQSPKKSSLFLADSRCQKDDEKQNRYCRTNYKQKNVKQTLFRGNKSLLNSNSTFDINQSIPYLDESEFREELNRGSFIQRVPSLNNMRRIQKCFKLLKN